MQLNYARVGMEAKIQSNPNNKKLAQYLKRVKFYRRVQHTGNTDTGLVPQSVGHPPAMWLMSDRLRHRAV